MLEVPRKKTLWIVVLVVIVLGTVLLVFESNFYKNKKEVAKPIQNMPSSQSSDQKSTGVDTLSLGKVYTQDDMRRMIEGFGKPSEEDIRLYQEDPRYEAFSELIKRLKGDATQEVLNALINEAYLGWFRQDGIDMKLDSGEIDMDGHDFGLVMIMKMDNDFMKELLTDEQYLSFMGQKKPTR